MNKITDQIKPPLTLRAIYFRKVENKISENFDPLIPGQRLIGQFRTTPDDAPQLTEAMLGNELQLKTVAFNTKFAFRYTTEVEKAKSGAEIEDSDVSASIFACIIADYIIDNDWKIDAASLERWSLNEVISHSWPYWREYCHTSLLKMALPNSIVPQFNTIKMPNSLSDKKTSNSKKRKKIAPLSTD